MPDPVPTRIFAAALTLFGRHGFRRTSMTDVAQEAGLSRATLYLRFPDKRALFAALAASVVDRALAGAKEAWTAGAPLSQNLAAMLLAKELELYRIIRMTPHGAELMTLDAELTRPHAERLEAGFAALLARRAREVAQEGADLDAFGGEAGFTAFLAAAGSSLKHEASTEAALRASLDRLARVSARAAGRT